VGEIRRILIVEDEIGLRHSLARYLESRGNTVTQAGCLAEAEVCLDRLEFDVVVLDVGLPDGDGLTLLRSPIAQRSLVITARPDPERFERNGVCKHLTKPLDLVEFAREVHLLGEA
jgi:DNA-binding response OmpR family regulator